MSQLSARSVSRPLWERWQKEGFDGRVLGVYDRACNLAARSGDVVTLVLPEAGDGPLNIVVEGPPGSFRDAEAGIPARLEGKHLRIARLAVALEGATAWEPRPEWRALRARREAIARRLPRLQALALTRAPAESLLSVFSSQRREGGPTLPVRGDSATRVQKAALEAVRSAAKVLRPGWAGDNARVRAAASRLAGLGSGLTPAGDDFLSGIMIRAWLAHPTPGPFCQVVLGAAAPRTGILSTAILRAAAAGQCSAAWHDLLGLLANGPDDELPRAVALVLTWGSTSGADTLAGFLWPGYPGGQPAYHDDRP